jgi:hypothetical protein
MSNVQIRDMEAVIELEPEVITASPGAATAPDPVASDMARLRALLRPVILELLDDELSRYRRMRG